MTQESIEEKAKKLSELISTKLKSQIVSVECSLGHAVVRIPRENMLDFFKILKLDTELGFNILLSVTAVDWLDKRENRFEVVYHLLSLQHLHRLRVKIDVPENNPEVDSLIDLWKSANFMERECWDMYGIKFKGHPNLKRILMYDEFKGHPLRKDYPVQGKQPRVPLRHPEVRNTAVDMHRPPLVKINKRKEKSVGQGVRS